MLFAPTNITDFLRRAACIYCHRGLGGSGEGGRYRGDRSGPLDADGLDDKGAIGSLHTELRDYLKIVIDRGWPDQQAAHALEGAEPICGSFRTTLSKLKPQTSGDAIIMQGMLKGLNDLFHAYHER